MYATNDTRQGYTRESLGAGLEFTLTGSARHAPERGFRALATLYGDSSLPLLVDNHSTDQKRGNHKPEYNRIDIHSALLATDHTRLWTD